MNMWLAIVLIVAMSMAASVLIERYKAIGRVERSKRSADDGRLAAERRAEEQREITELRERIKVLERIATDSNTAAALETRRVSDEIEALRDRQPS